MNRSCLISGGEVLTPAGRTRADVLVTDGIVAEVAEGLTPGDDVVVLDASDAVVTAGLVDLLPRLGGPGQEERETSVTAGRAAALGGVTTVLVASEPAAPIDSVAALRERQSLTSADVHEIYCGAITVGHGPDRLAPLGELAAEGVTAFSDGGCPVENLDLLRNALEYGSVLGATFFLHPEVPDLGRGGSMHEGSWSGRLGLKGRPAIAEILGVQRLLALCELTGARIHVHRVSTAAAAALVVGAAEAGLPVSCGVTPHHLVFTDADCRSYDTMRRFDPPLRPAADRDALAEAVASGAITTVCSDHSPHTAQSKELPFDQAPAGAVGIQTALGVVLGDVGLDPEVALSVLAWGPGRLLGDAAAGEISPGRPADLAVIEPEARWTVREGDLASRSRNSAFSGRELTGVVRHTVVGGRAVVVDGKGQW